MQETVDRAKAEFTQARGGLEHALANTPDDRIHWAPSDTARSPLRIAAHAAMAVGAMLGNLNGDTFAIPTTEAAERYFREAEKAYGTREEVAELLAKHSDAYFEWLDALTPERLAAEMTLPFGMGSVPTSVGIAVMPQHLAWHTAQINYVQTIYGDHDWHL